MKNFLALFVMGGMVFVGCTLNTAYFDEKSADVILTVDPTSVEVDASGEEVTITVTVTNGDGTTEVTAESSEDWVSISYSEDRTAAELTITLTVDSNDEENASDREATVTVSYEGAESVSVTVYQSSTDNAGSEAVTIGISSVSFLTNDNPQLEEDLYCTYDEASSTFTVRTPKIIDVSSMVATFIASGDVTVDDEVQQSGVTANDFTQDVTYVVSSGDLRHEYTVRVINFTGLPVIYIQSSTGKTPIYNDITSKEDWITATIRIDGNGVWDDLDETSISLRGRGNNTWDYDKKPFNMKFDKRTSLLGMPEHKRWVMLANYIDRTLVRNATTFYASELTSLAWTPRSRFVELYYNDVYTGTYQLTEHIRVDENRVNIYELGPDDTDITGGYLVEMDFHLDETVWCRWSPLVPNTRDGTNYYVKYPDEDDLTEAQFDYIKGFITDFEEAIMDDNIRSDSEFGYKKYIEPQSFIDYWLLFELCTNHELLNPGSIYLHKDRGGKLVAGPIWDFDYKTFNPDYAVSSLFVSEAIWYRYLFMDEEMKALAKQRWSELRSSFLTMPEYVDECATQLRYAAEENFSVWPMIVTTNYDYDLPYDEAIEKMKDVIKLRIAVIDECMASW